VMSARIVRTLAISDAVEKSEGVVKRDGLADPAKDTRTSPVWLEASPPASRTTSSPHSTSLQPG
jgi:hypothetical protein